MLAEVCTLLPTVDNQNMEDGHYKVLNDTMNSRHWLAQQGRDNPNYHHP